MNLNTQPAGFSQISLPAGRKYSSVLFGLLLIAGSVELLIRGWRFVAVGYARVSGTLCLCERNSDGLLFLAISITTLVLMAGGSFLTGLNYCVRPDGAPVKRWPGIMMVARTLVIIHLLVVLARFAFSI
ncbi:MAG: hypothetical protein U0Z53_28105 [Blastocatellia bacterium]